MAVFQQLHNGRVKKVKNRFGGEQPDARAWPGEDERTPRDVLVARRARLERRAMQQELRELNLVTGGPVSRAGKDGSSAASSSPHDPPVTAQTFDQNNLRLPIPAR